MSESDFARFADWAKRFARTNSAVAAARRTVEPLGLGLARERRRALAGLIRTNPARALELAVPRHIRRSLPPAIADELETPVSGRGDLMLLAALPEPGQEATVKVNFWKARINGREYDAYVFGRRLAQPSRRNIALQGIALDGAVAIGESPARVLDAGEIAAVRGTNTESFCGTSGLPTTTYQEETALETDGQIYFFCQSNHASAFEQQLITSEENRPVGDSGGGGAEASPWTEGRKRLLFIRVNFPDLTNVPVSDTSLISLNRNLDNFYTEMSYGRAGFYTNGAGSDFTPTFRLTNSAAWYGTNDFYNPLRSEARAAAAAAGYVLTNYDLDVICMGPVPGFGWSGLGYVGAPGAWLRNSFSTGVAGHELGHNFGLNHANFWDTKGASVIGPGTSVEYGDSYDTMGAASAGNNHFNARYKSFLNWLTTNEVKKVTTSGTYRVYAHDQTNVAAGVRALLVAKNSFTNYWIEFRQKFTTNPWLMNGAGLRWAQSGNQKSLLLDTTPGSPDGKKDSALVIGRTYADTSAGVYITPLDKGGTLPESLDVAINFGPFPTNVAPTITIAASDTNSTAGGMLTFSAAASDANGDALAYDWEFGDGTFGTNGAMAAKSWSADGEYVVRCTVSDLKGGTTSDLVIVTVGSPGTYRLSGVVLATNGPVQGVRVYVSTTRMSYTDSSGSYTIVGLPAGTYTAAASLYGYVFTNAGFANPIEVGPDVAGIDFLATAVNYDPPTILTQPTNQLVALGSNATFSVAAAGAPPLFYQWRFNNANIAGATSSNFTRVNVQAAHAGNYTCLVSNQNGTALSANAVLFLNSPPIITQQPSSQSAVAGGYARFNLTAVGAPTLAYQWWHNGTNQVGGRGGIGGSGGNDSGPMLYLANVQPTNAGTYFCVVTNPLGSVTSAVVTLTVNVTLTVTATHGGTISRSPDLESYPPDTAVELTATALGTYTFSGWSGDVVSANNPILVMPMTNLAVTANFAPPVPDLIVDNVDATLTGNWTASTTAANQYATNHLLTATSPNVPTATATFRPNLSVLANYDVFVWYPTISGAAADVPFTVVSATSSNSYSVNQSKSAGTWVLIVTNQLFVPGTNGFVRLANNASQGKNVAADAVRLAYSPIQPVLPPVLALFAASDGTRTLTWSSVPGQTYRVQFKDQLTDAVWQDLLPDVTATSVTASTTDTASATQRYYRVLAIP